MQYEEDSVYIGLQLFLEIFAQKSSDQHNTSPFPPYSTTLLRLDSWQLMLNCECRVRIIVFRGSTKILGTPLCHISTSRKSWSIILELSTSSVVTLDSKWSLTISATWFFLGEIRNCFDHLNFLSKYYCMLVSRRGNIHPLYTWRH